MFYNARWYDPALGRFTQADSIVPGGVQGYDRYAYVNNSPIVYNDPSGHDYDCGVLTCPEDMRADNGPRDKDGIDPKATLSYSVVLHPLDGYIVSQVPIYDYSYFPKKIIVYKMTYYAGDGNIHFDPVAGLRELLPFQKDPLTAISLELSILKGLENQIAKQLQALGLAATGSPELAAISEIATWTANIVTAAKAVNSAFTVDSYLQIEDRYLQSGPSPFPDNPFYLKIDPN
jgi:hypothetical protein